MDQKKMLLKKSFFTTRVKDDKLVQHRSSNTWTLLKILQIESECEVVNRATAEILKL